MKNLESLSIICIILQFIGFALSTLLGFIGFEKTPKNYHQIVTVLISIGGFAAIVNYFLLPTTIMSTIAGICGLGIIIVALVNKAQSV